MKTTIHKMSLMLLAMLFAASIFAQQMEVSGTVYDELKQPVAGVTVLEKGTNNGVATDMSGKYRIKTGKGKTLVFTYVGYLTQK